MIPRDLTGPTDADVAELLAGGWTAVGFERLYWRDPVDALATPRWWQWALDRARKDRPQFVDDSHTAGPFRAAAGGGLAVEWSVAGEGSEP